VIAIDRVPERLEMATAQGGAEVINYEETDAREMLNQMTGGRGPDVCIEAVGMESHGLGAAGAYDRVKQELKDETGRPHALRQAILSCRKGGTVSVAGVFGGFVDKLPMGAAFNKGLTFKMGQTHVHRYLKPLTDKISEGAIDPSFVITHKLNLDDAPDAYRRFRDKEDGCIKVMLRP